METGFLRALVLAAPVLGACGSHAAVPTTSVETGVAFDGEAFQPLLADVNGDGVNDLILRSTTHDTYVALDGASGKELWRTGPTKENDPDAFAWIAGNRLLSAASRVVNVFDLSSGKFLRAVNLESGAKLACEAAPGMGRVIVRGGTVTFDTETGSVLHDTGDDPCTEARTDVSVTKEPPAGAQVARVLCGKSPDDPCAKLADATPEIVPETMMSAADLGSIELGHKRQGKALPALALVKDGKAVWSAFPAVEKEGSPAKVSIDHGEVALLYDDSTGTRLFSWELSTGRQVLDVGVSRRARSVDGDSKSWLLSGSSIAFRVDKSTGKLGPIAGALEEAEPEWNPGWPVPRGYTTKTRAIPNGIEMAIGGAMFGGMMLINVIVYATVDDPVHHWNRQSNWPLLIPGVGPFINMGTVPPEFGTVTLLLFDAAIEGTGIVVFSVGAAQKTVDLVPVVRPTAGGATFGAQVSF